MAHSLEVRVPILEHHFVEWAASIPTDQKLSGADGKHCFKRALKSYLPHDVMYREKMGFAVPIVNWFRSELSERLHETVNGERLRAIGLFEPACLKQLVREHLSGARNYAPALWALVMFDGFLASLDDLPPEHRNSTCNENP